MFKVSFSYVLGLFFALRAHTPEGHALDQAAGLF
jgi:hypothetical protein